MISSRTMAQMDGWEEAAPGYWARDGWRIQRQTRGWRWWFVVVDRSLGTTHAGIRGTSPTLVAALRDVNFEIRMDAAPTTPEEA